MVLKWKLNESEIENIEPKISKMSWETKIINDNLVNSLIEKEENKVQTGDNKKQKKQFSFGKVEKSWDFEEIPYNREHVVVKLSYVKNMEGSYTKNVDQKYFKDIAWYTDEDGNLLPYLFLDDLIVDSEFQWKWLWFNVMEDLKKLAKEKCGGRLILWPANYGSKIKNPSPFYYKCGLRPTTKKWDEEILGYLNDWKPLKNSRSDYVMYLPIE